MNAGAERSDTGADAVKPDPRYSWKGHFVKVGARVRDESAEYCRVVLVQPLHVPSVMWPVRGTSAIAVR